MADALWSIDALVAASSGVADGARPTDAGGVYGISIDTRTLAPSDLFVALKDQRDGHEFVEAAFAKGAAAALVAHGYTRRPGDALLIRVDDVLAALERIGAAARARLSNEARVIAVTGSAGKTTTKEMLRACLEAVAPGHVHASDKSFNNHWGVPLTLARMPAATRYAVFEIGMNHAGEITPLVALVRPHVAVVTTVVAAHLEHFGTEEAIADAKAEIFSGLEPGGVAVVPGDNSHFKRLQQAALARPGIGIHVFCGRLPSEEEVMHKPLARHQWTYLGRSTNVDGQTLVHTTSGEFPLGLVGHHNVMNAIAVLCTLQAVGADAGKAMRALATMAPPSGRGSRTHVTLSDGALLLIDESYNANPASMRAALLAMTEIDRAAHPRRVAVLGDMLELGPQERELHEAIAGAIGEAGVDVVFACGPNMRHLFDALPATIRGAWAVNSAELKPALLAGLRGGDAVMIKGSNGSRMAPLVEMVQALGAKAA